jgi:hypothetical protein
VRSWRESKVRTIILLLVVFGWPLFALLGLWGVYRLMF